LDEAAAAAHRAVQVYKGCIDDVADPNSKQCDRGQADAQGVMGCGFVLAAQYSNAEPWLRPVADRGDDAVRPEVKSASLKAYARVLLEKGDLEPAQAVALRAKQFDEQHPTVRPPQ
jgi:hypothetical protein